MEKSNSNGLTKLPTLAELALAPEEAFKNDQFNLLLNQEPIESWLSDHPTAKRKNALGAQVAVKYLPIDKVEFLLTRIFQRWRTEILREGQLFQSIYVTVRLHYFNPITGEWDWQDGTGAVPVQTDGGKAASDLGAIKSGAVQMGLPAAESYAIKDAAEKIGKIFGKDINRNNTYGFAGAYSDEDKMHEQAQKIKEAMRNGS